MLTKLMRKHGGIKPIEGMLAAIDHFDQGIEHLGFLSDLVAETKMLLAFDEA
jgi:hypothetical protein